ncbi:hypothetical protein [Rhizobium mongolense]|uniref:hypothetical protein n=1 Tax=Rhizobium mongolense TaxID=57676 RepID=UPI0034A2DE87
MQWRSEFRVDLSGKTGRLAVAPVVGIDPCKARPVDYPVLGQLLLVIQPAAAAGEFEK